jgi:uncharacterized protein YprB with RNaseH-like and TPR domain
MLENTFIHLPDYGPRRERRLWEKGVLTWDDFLERFAGSPYHKRVSTRIASSKAALSFSDAYFFSQHLPDSEMWRCFPHFAKIAYVDIETTGLAPATDYITVAGLYDGRKVKSFVHGRNLDRFRAELAEYDVIVTFNGSMFDVPFLKSRIRALKVPPIHIDLRFLLASLDVRGGLKRIEERFSLSREDDLKGMNGYGAVLLWQAYLKRRDERLLDKLVRYNAADITNLKFLMEWAYSEKRKRTGIDEIPAMKSRKGAAGGAGGSGAGSADAGQTAGIDANLIDAALKGIP